MKSKLVYLIENKCLVLKEFELVPLKKGYVRVVVKCSGVNRADILQAKGIYPSSKDYGDIPGLEFSGIVLDSNCTEKDWEVDKKVIGLLEGGCYSSIVDVAETSLIETTSKLSFEELACIPESYATAYLNIILLGQVNSESRVLVYSAAGGVGLAALHILRNIGAEVVGVVGQESKADYLYSLGFKEVVNYKEESFRNFLASNSNGFTHILDTVGASYFSANCEMLRYKGKVLLIGLLGGNRTELDLSKLLKKNITIIASTLRSQDIETKSKILNFISSVILPSIDAQKSDFLPCLDSVFSYKSVNEAFDHLIHHKNTGNVVLKWDIKQ